MEPSDNTVNDLDITSFTFIKDGKTYNAWKATQETLDLLQKEGIQTGPGGDCPCGTSPYCSPYTRKLVLCQGIPSDRPIQRCQWWETDAPC